MMLRNSNVNQPPQFICVTIFKGKQIMTSCEKTNKYANAYLTYHHSITEK